MANRVPMANSQRRVRVSKYAYPWFALVSMMEKVREATNTVLKTSTAVVSRFQL